MQSTRGALIDGVAVDGSALAMNSLVAELQFAFPQQTAEVARSMVRTELAHREAKRLGIQLPSGAIDEAMDSFESVLVQRIGSSSDLDDWALAQHQQPWAVVREQYQQHLVDNLIYQVVLRADALQHERVKMWWLLAADLEQANGWARSLSSGRAPASLLSESLLPGPEPDGSYPPHATYLPGEAGELLANPKAGEVIGPVQLPGDNSWMVGQVIARLPAQQELPPVAVLLEDLREHPVGPLEARSWFEEMSRRYTASATFAPVSAPLEAFVPIR